MKKATSVMVPGSVVTQRTAKDYLIRLSRIIYNDLSIESSVVLHEIEERLVNAGYIDWNEANEIEIEALKQLNEKEI